MENGLEIFKVMVMKSSNLWNITLCVLLKVSYVDVLLGLVFHPEAEENVFFQNIS
jgi:hypothetical protein